HRENDEGRALPLCSLCSLWRMHLMMIAKKLWSAAIRLKTADDQLVGTRPEPLVHAIGQTAAGAVVRVVSIRGVALAPGPVRAFNRFGDEADAAIDHGKVHSAGVLAGRGPTNGGVGRRIRRIH